jgi:V/A-type H+-transporting ATPase subunit A
VSYSEEALTVAEWWRAVFAALPDAGESAGADGDNPWQTLRQRFLTLLGEQARLERMARIVGKDALQPRQRLTLLCAEVVNEAFLRQSAFSINDRYCGPRRQALMMRLLGRFIDLAEGALERGVSPETMAALAILRPLQRMGEDLGEEATQAFATLETTLLAAFGALTAEVPDAP